MEIHHDYWSNDHIGHLLQSLFLHSRLQSQLCHGHPEQHFLHTDLCDPGFTDWSWNMECHLFFDPRHSTDLSNGRCLSVSQSVYLSLSPCLCLSLCLFLFVCVSLSLSVSVCPSVSLSLSFSRSHVCVTVCGGHMRIIICVLN